MRVFVTGATGFLGRAITSELQRRGHDVVGLARSERSADKLRGAGAAVHLGDIADPGSFTPALDDMDAVVHTAFDHDFFRYEENCEKDRQLLDAMARALEGTDKALIAASATVVAGSGMPAKERDQAVEQVLRSASEAFLDYATSGVRTGVVRLPPTVYGPGDSAFVPALIGIARERGVSAFIEGGMNRWPAVHRDDAARLFCDAVERAAPATRYHAVTETGIAFRTIAEAIGKGVSVPTQSIPREQAEEHFGWLAMFAALDAPASSEMTCKTYGWKPREPGLIETMHSAGYFDDTSF